MFDRTIINQKKEVNNIHVNNKPQDIAFDVKKQEEDSFFQTIEMNGKNYNNLMGENPFIIKTERVQLRDDEYRFDPRERAMGSYLDEKEIPVKVIKITATGNNKCLVELKLIK